MADGPREGARRLDQPRAARGLGNLVRLDPDTIGRLAEGIARFLGTGRFLAIQTMIVVVWIALNVFAVQLRWDPYPFILLNLAFSTQAAYAAPLILLAQNRQTDRDRVQAEEDRARAASTRADTEYLARELASLRVAVGELATRDFIRGELQRAIGGDEGDAAAAAAERKKKQKKKREAAAAAAAARSGSSSTADRRPPRRREEPLS
ncbi:DUF1003 domain-containing protein [Modestobacter sp. I12A-02628]|uniref:DUF1003 domain-containing protein n=1 Tax=Goekera deserti TaxID=2497753 RepID=A0A7K3WC61_9ACTN|nr:DUF1003 domain-containing protein [Goekera deserti]MPQ98487.1 DUF1003 domain-containing protein [Goekera deserti]NDI48316.1 DUF1003 domain-containing protein [Goekera deserti]NEL54065.1 DUF1003 domain-containing protein [Goekera deserti]